MAAHQAPLSLGFSRQEHWSGLPFPAPMRESEIAQSSPTLSDPMDCSLPGSSTHGIFQARVLEWVAIAFSNLHTTFLQNFEVEIDKKVLFVCLFFPSLFKGTRWSIKQETLSGREDFLKLTLPHGWKVATSSWMWSSSPEGEGPFKMKVTSQVLF